MVEPSDSVNAAFDAARKAERGERDGSIDDELDLTDRLATALGSSPDQPVVD